MDKKVIMAGSVLSIIASAAGVFALSGCVSNMTALDSDMPNAVSGSLKGEYALEQIESKADVVGVGDIYAAVKKDAAMRSIFKGNVEDDNALPITINIDCTGTDGNGAIASVNNFFSICTLTIWPWVSANEYAYTVTASSVVGSHQVNFTVLDRSWFGLSPFAIIPVPGWSDERGDPDKLKQFHATLIAQAAKEACAELPNDYATFKKDHAKYLEQISQMRSEKAFAAFLKASTPKAKVDALAKMVNASVMAKYQNDLIAAFKSNSDGSVRAAILTKLNDGSFDKLPYDPTLISYWSKLNNSKLLAMVYRDGCAKLSEVDCKNLVAKITDDVLLSELVTPPNKDEVAKYQRRKHEIESSISWKQESIKKWELTGIGKYAKERINSIRSEIKELEEELSQLNMKDVEGLYVKDAKGRKIIYQAMKPTIVKELAKSILSAHTLEDWNSKDVSALESVADMSVAVADENVSAEIAISLACKVDSYWRECKGSWSCRWNDTDRQQWSALKKKIAPALTDEILVSKIKTDRNLWSALSELIGDKSKVSALAYGFVDEAVRSGKEKNIYEMWKSYGDNISDDTMLMKLSVDVLPLRRSAFLKIKDDAMKEKTLSAIKDELNSELKKCAEKQGELANFIAEINNGDELKAWIRGKSGQTKIQREQSFNQLKGRIVVLKGDVREIGKTMLTRNLYASLTVGNISTFVNMNVQFNIPDTLTPTVSSWQKGETYVMRGKITSTGGLIEDAVAEDSEIIKTEDYDAAIGLKDEMDNIKWQLKEIDEKKMPPESVTPSKFGGAVKKAAGWLKRGLDDIMSSGDDLNEAAEMLGL